MNKRVHDSGETVCNWYSVGDPTVQLQRLELRPAQLFDWNSPCHSAAVNNIFQQFYKNMNTAKPHV